MNPVLRLRGLLTRRPSVAALAVFSMTLASCGAAGGEETAADFNPQNGPLAKLLGWDISPAEQREKDLDVQQVLVECMKADGWEYEPVDYSVSNPYQDEYEEQMAERVGLGHRLGFEPIRLSGGERQRVAIARALLGQPSLLLCDEPTGNLDLKNTESVLELFDDLREQGLTIMVITHDNDVAKRAQRRVGMIDGELGNLT